MLACTWFVRLSGTPSNRWPLTTELSPLRILSKGTVFYFRGASPHRVRWKCWRNARGRFWFRDRPSWMSLIADACMRWIRTSETRWSRDHFDYTFEMLACTWFVRLTKHFRQKETTLARDHPHRKLHIADAGLHLVRAAEWNSKQNKHF